MISFVRLLSGSLLLAGLVSIVYLNLYFAWEPELSWHYLRRGFVFVPFGPWGGLAFTVLCGVFLLLSVTPNRES